RPRGYCPTDPFPARGHRGSGQSGDHREQAWASIGAMGRLVFHKRPLKQVFCLRLQRQLPRKSSVFCLKSMLPGTAWLGSYNQPAANEEVTMSHRSDTKTSAQDQPAWHTMEAVEVEQR